MRAMGAAVPTRVGVNRIGPPIRATAVGRPHAGGGEPDTPGQADGETEPSPRGWG